MKMLKTSIRFNKNNLSGYLSSKYTSSSDGVKFHLVTELNQHIDGYWLFEISRSELRLMNEVGTGYSVNKSDIDTSMSYNRGKLKLVGVDEI